MKMMRDFVTDARIHRTLDEVESWIGYELPARIMPIPHRRNSRCSMHISDITGIAELLYIEEEPQNQATYCHELMHLVLWINGDPSLCTINSTPLSCAPFSAIRSAWYLIQHVPLWHFVKILGFDEIEDHRPLTEDLIYAISRNVLHQDAPHPDLILPYQAVTLALGLSYPATLATRDKIRKVAEEKIPQALELADARVLAFEKQPQFSPQEFLDALTDLLSLLRVPTESLKPSFLDKTSPNFRSRILEVANS